MSDSIDYTSLFRLDGRKVVVVGGGSGLGSAASIALAQYGATLVVADVNVGGLKDTVAEIEAHGHSAESAEVDVTDTESVDALAAAHPDTEVLVATPGVNVRKQLLNTTDDEFDRGHRRQPEGHVPACRGVRTGAGRPWQGQHHQLLQHWSSSRVRVCTPPPKAGCCN